MAVNERKNRVVTAEADVSAWNKFRSALANDDVASDHGLAAEFFYAEPFTYTIASILDAALTFFVSHMPRLRGNCLYLESGESPDGGPPCGGSLSGV